MEIIELLKNPLKLKEEKLFLIQNELEKYPYFQPLYLLQAKALKKADKETFVKGVEQAALYCSNRKILFDYLHYETPIEKVEDAELINEVDENLNKEVNKIDETLEFTEQKSPLTCELQEVKTEGHSFGQWLKSGKLDLNKNKISTTTEANNNEEGLDEKIKIINEFLEKNPKISPKKEEKINISTPTQTGGMSHLMTETLAKIYVEQKKYDKAIKAYNILRLKYPEKSGFFADQINLVKQLKNN